MNSYLEAFKRLKDESMRDDLEDIMEDLLSIVAEDRGNNYVISSRRLSSIIGGMNMSNFWSKILPNYWETFWYEHTIMGN